MRVRKRFNCAAARQATADGADAPAAVRSSRSAAAVAAPRPSRAAPAAVLPPAVVVVVVPVRADRVRRRRTARADAADKQKNRVRPVFFRPDEVDFDCADCANLADCVNFADVVASALQMLVVNNTRYATMWGIGFRPLNHADMGGKREQQQSQQ